MDRGDGELQSMHGVSRSWTQLSDSHTHRHTHTQTHTHTHTHTINPNIFRSIHIIYSFPDSSAGKESSCNAGDPSWIPGSGRSTAEGIGNPLQYSWVSLVAQLVKNLHAMWETWETWVQSLGWEDPIKMATDTHSSILAWIISWTV